MVKSEEVKSSIPAPLVVAYSACSRPYPKEYALSLTPTLLLSAKNRRTFGFFAGLTENRACYPSALKLCRGDQ